MLFFPANAFYAGGLLCKTPENANPYIINYFFSDSTHLTSSPTGVFGSMHYSR